MNRIALVVGVSRGIGYGIVNQLAKDGHTVIMMARNEQRLNEIRQEFKAKGIDTDVYAADVSDRVMLKEKICGIIQKYKKIDILVNNVGLMPFPASLTDTTDEWWDNMISVNLTGVFNIIKAVLPTMQENKYGRIINVSSISARKTVGMFVGYAAAKSGLHGFTTALANEVMHSGITVNCVLPGFTETEEMHRIWGTMAKGAEMTEDEILAPFWAQVPLGRWIQPDEIGAAVAFLASDKANVITGQLLRVDGGYDSHD